MPSAGQAVEQLEASRIALGNKNGIIILKNSLIVSYKVKHTMWFKNFTPSFLPPQNEKLSSQRFAHECSRQHYLQ